jgi:hypothetical protein
VLKERTHACRSTGAAGTYLWGGLCRIDVLDAPLTTSLVFYGSKALRIEAMPLLESSPGGVSQEESCLAYLEIESFSFDSVSCAFDCFAQHGIISTGSLTIYLNCAGSRSTESAGGGVPVERGTVETEATVKQAAVGSEGTETLEEHSSDRKAQAESITGAGHERHSSPMDDSRATFVASRGGLAVAKEVSAHPAPSMSSPLVCPVTSTMGQDGSLPPSHSSGSQTSDGEIL